ncbi:MAG: aminotransferase class V-fold PLP-dependent enzyme [bacterium]
MSDFLDHDTRARLFPALDARSIFLNHAGIAPISGPAAAALERYAREAQAPTPEVLRGWLAEKARARRAVADLIGAATEEIAFMPNTTVAVATIANGLALGPGDRVIGFEGDYPANVLPWRRLARHGVEHVLAPAPDGLPDLAALERLVDERTRVVAVSTVCFWSGARAPLGDIVRIARRHGALVAVDGVQSIGALCLDVGSADVDFVACGGLKWMLSPMGVGFLFVRRALLDRLEVTEPGADANDPPLPYLDYRERLRADAARFEGGTQPTGNLFAIGASARMFLDLGRERIEEAVLANGERLASGLCERGFRVLSPRDPALRSGIVAFRHRALDNRTVVETLGAKGVRCIEREGWVRFAPHFYHRADELDRALAALPP